MKINFIFLGKLKEKYLVDAFKEYEKRLSRFAKISVTEINDEKIPNNASKKDEEILLEKEGSKVLEKIPNNSFLVVMDIQGKELTSLDFSREIKNLEIKGISSLTFVIGGSLGLSNQVKEKADLRLSFPKMTFPHQLFRVMLIEQIYRAYKINANETYHK